jgi:hypothetical protein
MYQNDDKPRNWKKLVKKVKEIEGNENISDELAERVVDFLYMLAELEVRMRSEGLYPNESSKSSKK